MNYQLAHNSHAGIKRNHNEDTYGINQQQHTFLVADGMGGHDHGEIASALARDYTLHGLDNNKTIQQSITDANEAIISNSLEKGSQLPMGTTIAVIQFKNQQYQCAWVGDSRIYQFRNQQLKAISSDHSYVQELVYQKLITSEQARSHPHRNVVTQALGVTDNHELKIATLTGDIESGDKYLLCSDGLTEEVEDKALGEILTKDISPQETCDQLILAALENGGSDNITAIVICID
jgi:protein phosphatase